MARSLFDEAVPKETKWGILSAMIMVESDESDGDDEDPPKRVELKGSAIPVPTRIVCNSLINEFAEVLENQQTSSMKTQKT